MATITERNKTNGKPSFTAQVRIKKSGKVIFSKSETFTQRKLAEKWAALTEKSWHDGSYSLVAPASTFAALIKRYRMDIEKEVGMAQLADLTAPEMSTATGFHRDNTGLQLAEEGQHLTPPQLLAQNRLLRSIRRVGLKHILRQIEPDRDNLRHDRSPLWIVADPPWHIDAVGGRSHHKGRSDVPKRIFRAFDVLTGEPDFETNC